MHYQLDPLCLQPETKMYTSLELLLFTTLAILSISLLLLIKRLFSSATTTTIKLPPSPPCLPLIGNLHNMGPRHPHRSLHCLSRRYGPLMLLRFGGVPVIVVSSADTAREVMKTHDLSFADRPRSSIFEKLLYDHRDIAAAPYGKYWSQTKAISVIHLLSTARVKSFRHVRAEETETLMAKIKASAFNSAPVNLSEAFAKLTNDIVCRAALGKKVVDDDDKLKRVLSEFVELLGYVDVGDYIKWLWWVRFVSGVNGRMERVRKELDEFLDGVVEDHMKKWKFDDENYEDFGSLDSKVEMDFVDVLLWIQRKNGSDDGFPFDKDCLKALILDSFAAGTDTTYTVIEWAMTELLRHPSAMKNLQTELTQVSSENMNIIEDDLEKCYYLKAVIKETLRLHPPIPLLVPRLSRKDVNLQGYHIPARTQVIINAWSIGRDPGSWERSEEFLPDRFLKSDVDFRGQHFQFVPFGSGRRSCPGVAFAMAVNEVVLANVVRRFEWRLVEDGEEMNMEESEGITIHRKLPLIAIPFSK